MSFLTQIIFVSALLISLLWGQNYQLESNADCQVCHEDIYQQWQQSRHARSTADNDVLYRGMLQWASEDTEGRITAKCKNCHTPYFSTQDNPLISNSHRERPVDCVYCHSIDSLPLNPVFSNIKYSSRENNRSEYHQIKMRKHFKNEELCLQCHAELSNPNQVAICVTGNEYYEQSALQTNCQTCHMPDIAGYKATQNDSLTQLKSHAFLGPHNPSFLNGSLKLTGKYENKQLTVYLDNSKTPHGYPTGTPLRMVLLKVIGLDANDKIVYQNWKVNPVMEDPKSVFVRLFEDKNKNFPVPPWQATAIRMETRLRAGEVRKIVYEINEAVRRINVKLFFQLAPLPILNRLKIDDPYLRTSHLIDELTLVLN